MPTMYRILVGCALITAVALVSDRSSALAGILGTAPINIPIVLWIIWSKSASNYPDVELTSRSMLLGITSTACFIAVCWYGFSRRHRQCGGGVRPSAAAAAGRAWLE